MGMDSSAEVESSKARLRVSWRSERYSMSSNYLTHRHWLTAILLCIWALPALAVAQDSQPPTGTPEAAPVGAAEPRSQESESHEGGFLLLAPLGSTDVQIIDRTGSPIHLWKGERRPGHSVYLLDDGSLLRTGAIGRRGAFGFQGGGAGGVI